MKLKEIIIRSFFILPLAVVALVPYLALLVLSRFFAFLSDAFESCANWLNLGVWSFRDWVLVVTGIEEKEKGEEVPF